MHTETWSNYKFEIFVIIFIFTESPAQFFYPSLICSMPLFVMILNKASNICLAPNPGLTRISLSTYHLPNHLTHQAKYQLSFPRDYRRSSLHWHLRPTHRVRLTIYQPSFEPMSIPSAKPAYMQAKGYHSCLQMLSHRRRPSKNDFEKGKSQVLHVPKGNAIIYFTCQLSSSSIVS